MQHAQDTLDQPTSQQSVTSSRQATSEKGARSGMEAAMRHDQRSRTLFSQLDFSSLPLAGKLPAPPNRPFQAKVTTCCNNGAPLLALPQKNLTPPQDSIGRVPSREGVLHGAGDFPRPPASIQLRNQKRKTGERYVHVHIVSTGTAAQSSTLH
ncbi:hypothetical protein N656DRAFT_783069 [Canariomyces notabilis]|uniref:Uncharacterized protein n=1 Tax=Canariomyces notabilis TaxID=2074819 RepID=A0AAN6QGZ4_9PEZI|nr:hypothetical protein N656DRAFT_783069 [Canariomyces arenarius]